MSSETTLPLDWPPLLDECRAWAAGVAVYLGCDTATEDRLCAYRLSVLADLEIGASRDFWARKLAEWVGLDVGATAPCWRRVAPELNDDPADHRPPQWWLGLDENVGVAFVEPWSYFAPHGARIAPGISAESDPAAALRLALLSVRP